jgi:acyl dehydratase
MPIDLDVALGAQLPDRTFSWTASDVLLYHLGIGAGSRKGDNLSPAALRWTNDDDNLQVLPSFGIVAPTFHLDVPPPLDLPGCDLDLQMIVHGAQEVTVHRPLPTSGTATLSSHISDIWDKGKAAVLWQEGTARDESGEALWTVRSSMFIRGEGGFGGSRGDATSVAVPERTADTSLSFDVAPNQALLYRLCGDRNPLHADPAFAKGAGFPAPILHGLCTYGIVLREVTDALLDGDASKVGGFAARFAGVVFPGETIHIDAWDEGNSIVVNATVGDDRRPALADCVVTRA